MAGNISPDGTIWVAGETYGKDQSGATVTLSAVLPVSNDDLVDYVDAVASGVIVDSEAYTDILRASLVASGVLPV